jgi:ABC-type dipeptide/oligopeptide/nickel transport system ATPase component
MIFQDPMTALNPVLTIGKQMSEILVRNKSCQKSGKSCGHCHAGAGRHCRA